MVVEEVSATTDLVSIVLPIVLGVAMVLVTVAIVFWIGTGNQRSFEEAKLRASRKAEETLKEKEKVSPKAKKPRKNFRKKKPELQEDHELVPRKGILKFASMSVERPSPNKVEFILDTPVKEEMKTPRTNPPTPYPNKEYSLVQAPQTAEAAVERVPQLDFEEKEEVVEPIEPKKSKKLSGPAPMEKTPRPLVGEQEPVKHVMPKEEEGRKKLGSVPPKRPKGGKGKPPAVPKDAQDVLPASRITDIVGASSLADEEIQRLIELLLEKSNANSEWEAANLKAESNKSLKKQNQELQSKLEEAQRAVVSHGSRIKELRREIQAEKNKHQSAENSFQAKLAQQGNEMAIYKTRSSGLEEELKQLKARTDTHHLQKLRDENNQLIARLQQQQSTINSQLKELDRAKDAALKASSAAAPASVLAEKDSLLERKTREIEQTQLNLQHSHSESVRLKKELQALADIRDNRDALKQKVDSLEAAKTQLVVEAQYASAAKDDSLAKIGVLRETMEKARADDILQAKAELRAQHEKEVEGLKKRLVEAESLRASVTTARADDVSQAKAELQVQHEKEVEGLRRNLEKLRESVDTSRADVSQAKAELRAQHEKEMEELRRNLAEAEGLRKNVATLEERNEHLTAQVKRCSSLEQQVASLGQQLEAEQASKKDLLSELEQQRKTQLNGPVSLESLSNGASDQLQPALEERGSSKEVMILEKKLEDLKCKNNELSESLWQAKDEAGTAEKAWENRLKQAQEEAELRTASAKSEVLGEVYAGQKVLLQQLFPDLSVKGCDGKYEQWLERFESKALDFVSSRREENASLKERVEDLEKQKEENTGEIKHFRVTLETTMGILEKLRTEVETSSSQHQLALKEKDAALEAECSTNRHLQEELRTEHELVNRVREELQTEHELVNRVREELRTEHELVNRVREELQTEHELVNRVREELEEEKEAMSRVQEEMEAMRTAGEQQEEVARLEERLQEVEQGRKNMEQKVADLHEVLREREVAQQKLEELVAAECRQREEAVKKSDLLEQQKNEVAERLEIMKQSNRDLNARISHMTVTPSATESEI